MIFVYRVYSPQSEMFFPLSARSVHFPIYARVQATNCITDLGSTWAPWIGAKKNTTGHA
jgi:hypothetical protein